MMDTIAGIIKESAPKQTKQMIEAIRPMNAEVWSLSFNHCSKKITTNIAVITKLMPFVSNLSNDPTRPPIVAPENQ